MSESVENGHFGCAQCKRFRNWRLLLSPLVILLLAVPALQPLFSHQLTCGFDNVFHLWRSVEIAELLQSGVLFSRWAPHMARGYGYPLYLFQSPLSAYGTAVFHLIGFSWPAALNSMYALGLLLSALTTWWLARDLWGELGGIVAAVAMLFAPFHLYVVMYRGSLSETVAWIFPPLVLWGLRRWQLFGQRRGVATAVLALTTLFFTHDVTAYAFFPFFVVWAVGLSWNENGTQTANKIAFADERGLIESSGNLREFRSELFWKRLGRGGGALLLGLGGGAFFWLPAVVERSSIQFERASSAWPFLYNNNFLPLEQLLALPRNADPLLLNDWPPRGLGAVLLVGVLLGIVMGWRLGGEKRRITAVLTFIFAAYLFVTSSFSTILWENISILTAFQFPWRFLAPATLAAAMLIGAIPEAQPPVPNPRFGFAIYDLRFTMGAVVIVALSVLHWGWLYPEHCAIPEDTSLVGMVEWELGTGTLGTTASRELLPVTVKQAPQEPDVLLPWEARILPQDLPEGAQIHHADYEPLGSNIELTSPTPFVIRYRAFDFPGWQVTINGEPVAITPSDPGGLITFPVPDGRSIIHITFTTTPLRRTADIISLLSIILLAIILIRSPQSFIPSPHHHITPSPHHPITPSPLHLVILSLLLVAARLWLVDTQYTPLRQSQLTENGELAGVDVPLNFVFGDPAHPAQIRLLGYEGMETAVPANQPLTVTLYWRALTRLDKAYRVGLTLVDQHGRRWSADGLRDYRWARNPEPTTTWPTDHYVLTSYFVDPLPGTPPGRYTLELSLFDQATFVPLTIYDAAGQPLGPTVSLAAVTLTAPPQPWQADAIEMQDRLHASLNGLTLWGSDGGRGAAAPGDDLLLTLFWSTERAQAAGELELVDQGGTAVSSWPVTFINHGAGVWRHQQAVRLPAGLEDGVYQWQFSVPTGEAVQWGELTVDAPERLFHRPDMSQEVNITFGKQITLVGVNFADAALASEQPISIELIWQGVAEMSESYRVFVHLLAPDGTVLAQSDAIPAAWTRPTTGWLPGEYIIDVHYLSVPSDLEPGSYQLRVGMYLPGGTRLHAPAGDDSVLLPIGNP